MIAEYELTGLQLCFDQPEEGELKWGIALTDPNTGKPFSGVRELSRMDRFFNNNLNWTVSDTDRLVITASVALTALGFLATRNPEFVLALKSVLMTQTK